MNLGVLRAIALLHRATFRRSLRKPGFYVGWAFAVGAGIGVQVFLGVGATSTDDRPSSASAGVVILALLAVAAVSSGAMGPPLSVGRPEAQWLVTAPGGAAGMVAMRLLLRLTLPFLEVVLLVLCAQLVVSSGSSLGVALVLALWSVGVGLTTMSVGYATAAFFETRDHPRLTRLASAVVAGPTVWALSGLHGVMSAIGRPGRGAGGAALLSAACWLALGLAVGAVALNRAEGLVLKSVRLSARKEPSFYYRSKRGMPSPETFRLGGARTSFWLARAHWSRGMRVTLMAELGFVVLTAVLVVFAHDWAPCLAAFLVLGSMLTYGIPSDSPVAADLRLLPGSVRASTAYRVTGTVLFELINVGTPWVALLALRGGTADVRVAGTLCLVPTMAFIAIVGHVGPHETETISEVGRRRRLVAFPVLAVAAAAAVLAPGWQGGLLAGAILLAAALVVGAYVVRVKESYLSAPSGLVSA